jgi:hypothetical protein
VPNVRVSFMLHNEYLKTIRTSSHNHTWPLSADMKIH